MRFYQLDNDTKKYIKRLNYNGFKTPTDIYSVDQFVRGIKDLGLWSYMICWPLRANQNAGSGNIAYSLGALGIYNATLNNSPSWQANGLITNGTNQWVDATIPTSSAWSFVAIMSRINNSDAEPKYYWGLYYSAQSSSLSGNTYYLKDVGLGIFQSDNSINNWSPSRPAANATTNFGFQSVAYSESGPSANVSLNGSFSAQSSVRNLSAIRQDRMVLARRAGDASNYGNAAHSFYSYFNLQLSNSTIESIRALCKSTISKGLALP